MTRRTPPAITADRHMTLGNLLKDVTEELIVRRASNAVVAINRLKTALEYELKLTIPLELDPRCILEQIYYGGGRFQLCSVEGEPDAFAHWREVHSL
jgi:hypothetical protein